jgi:phage terminase large subunit-like protein
LTKARRKTKTTPACSLNAKAADIAIRFFEENLTHSKGELGGKAFVLEQWQKDYVGKLFGTMNGEVRQYRTSLLAIPRKNGKSTLCAGIALKLMFDGEPGAEIYSCAADRDQARLVFEMAKGLRRELAQAAEPAASVPQLDRA